MCLQIYMTVVTAVITNIMLIIKYYLCTTNNHGATNKSWLKFSRNYQTIIIISK